MNKTARSAGYAGSSRPAQRRSVSATSCPRPSDTALDAARDPPAWSGRAKRWTRSARGFRERSRGRCSRTRAATSSWAFARAALCRDGAEDGAQARPRARGGAGADYCVGERARARGERKTLSWREGGRARVDQRESPLVSLERSGPSGRECRGRRRGIRAGAVVSLLQTTDRRTSTEAPCAENARRLSAWPAGTGYGGGSEPSPFLAAIAGAAGGTRRPASADAAGARVDLDVSPEAPCRSSISPSSCSMSSCFF